MNNKPGWKSFVELCSQTQSAEQLDAILKTFFTLEEQAQMADRVLLVKALLSGEKTQREIAADLKISIAKITRGSNQLKTTDPELLEYLKTQIK
jgi:TrpR family transcriptional regulator, trp operon repressor